MGDSNNVAVMLAFNEVKRIYTDHHIRAYPRHPRDPCSIVNDLEAAGSWKPYPVYMDPGAQRLEKAPEHGDAMMVLLSRINKPQMKAPRVTPLEGVYTYALRCIRGCGVENLPGFGTDERRLIASFQREECKAHLHKSSYLEEIIRPGTRMTWIKRIYTDPCVSVSSAQSVFYRIYTIIEDHKKPQMNAESEGYENHSN